MAIVTGKGNWLVGSKLLGKHGFETVGQAPPSFELMVKQFRKGSLPSFSNNWDACHKQYARGLTVIRSDQCPYLEDATRTIVEVADEIGFQSKVVELKTCKDVQQNSPSAYGVFNVVYNGELLSYHYLTRKELQKRLQKV